ncbi:Gfo/Idh/MocA family oxidoreductase [Paenibacillus sp. HJGM_3]|uniref:Gfo/Idh/MocA family oxidoreductase n=1 Tax=Paenibacillus sp. HJGM_3 TaxID=3379816 RepID=UPI003859F413
MKKYVLVGAGHRAFNMFAKSFKTELREIARLAGIFDTNLVRAQAMSKACGNVDVYVDFDAMIREAKPDAVIVTTPDSLHHHYIIRALEAGCDAISEKPMTTDSEKCQAILDAERRTGRQVIVTFNVRFLPHTARIKELIREGSIGDILSIHLEWSLDQSHGADYFRRWHRNMKNSGGLLVHKSTHHFDLVNWWLADEPESVFAHGSTRFYGPTRQKRGDRCSTCDHKSSCEFYFDMRDGAMGHFYKEFYLEAEHVDGYFRDRCVFSDDIDIYDTLSLTVRYMRGALLSYSLKAYSPYEGWKVTLTGTEGRIEADGFYSGPDHDARHQSIHVYNREGERTVIQIEKSSGSHGGSDALLRSMIFRTNVPDPLEQQAGSRAGAMSLLIGAAANISIKENRPVTIKELLGEFY